VLIRWILVLSYSYLLPIKPDDQLCRRRNHGTLPTIA
jgi:hypothetical protein